MAKTLENGPPSEAEAKKVSNSPANNEWRSRTNVRRRGLTFRQCRMGQQQLTLKDALNHVDQAVESDPGQWNALCPAHNDTSPSLSLRENERKLLLCCHTGCSYLEILEAIKARRTKASSRDPQLRPNSLAAVPAQANGRIEPKRIVGIKTPNPKKLKSCRKAKSDFAAEARRYESEITSDQLSQLVAGPTHQKFAVSKTLSK